MLFFCLLLMIATKRYHFRSLRAYIRSRRCSKKDETSSMASTLLPSASTATRCSSFDTNQTLTSKYFTSYTDLSSDLHNLPFDLTIVKTRKRDRTIRTLRRCLKDVTKVTQRRAPDLDPVIFGDSCGPLWIQNSMSETETCRLFIESVEKTRL